MEMPTIWTIGYERLRPEMLAAELQAAGVERVIDVRERAQSRKPGMSKTRLGQMLGEHQITYEHRRALGTPPELRHLYRTNKVERAAAAFREHVESTAREELDALAAELDDGPKTALLCLEEEPQHCHRRVLTDALRDRRADLEVVDL
jgi:uncharacterized protein (DUF488 family)